MRVDIRPANLDDAHYIGHFVRPADLQEHRAASGRHPYFAMQRGLEEGSVAMTGTIDGTPVCMWGVRRESLLNNIGIPWMVGTVALDSNAMLFLRRCRKPVLELLGGYDMLVNYVDERNTRAIEWLRFCGFEIGEPEPYGVAGLPFHKFWMKGDCNV